MCVRLLGRSSELLKPVVSLLGKSQEILQQEGAVAVIGKSSETFLREVALINGSTELIFTEDEFIVQFPDLDAEMDIPTFVPVDHDEEEPPEFIDPTDPLQPPGTWPLRVKESPAHTGRYLIPPPTVTATLGGLELTNYIKEISVSETRGGPCTGSIVCRDRTGFLASALSTFALDNALLKAHSMDFSRTLNIRIVQKGIATKYPTFIPLDPSWDEDGNVTIGFTDGNALLDLDNQTLPNIVAEEGVQGKSNATLVSLGSLAGVSVSSTLPDYPIRTFRFNNQNVIQGMDQIMQIMQGYRLFKGQKCLIESLNPSRPPSWSLTDRFHIESLTASLDTTGLRTFFRAFRNETQSTAIAAPLSCIGGECVGRVVNLTFDSPVSYAAVYYSSPNGRVLDGVFFNEEGTPLNITPTNIFRENRGGKAVRWEATFRPGFYGSKAYIPQWRVWAIGGAPPSGLDTSEFTVERAASTVEAFFGRRPEFNDMQSDLVKDNATLSLMLDKIVAEVEWSVRRFNLSTPFLNPIRVGEFIRVTDSLFSLQENLLVENWRHNWSTSSGFSADYELRGKL